jgi:excisionase family DNA binding protein
MKRTIALGESLLTVSQYASRINIKESTVRAWLLAGKLCKVKVGPRLVRIPEREVERVIDEGFVAARKEIR